MIASKSAGSASAALVGRSAPPRRLRSRGNVGGFAVGRSGRQRRTRARRRRTRPRRGGSAAGVGGSASYDGALGGDVLAAAGAGARRSDVRRAASAARSRRRGARRRPGRCRTRTRGLGRAALSASSCGACRRSQPRLGGWLGSRSPRRRASRNGAHVVRRPRGPPRRPLRPRPSPQSAASSAAVTSGSADSGSATGAASDRDRESRRRSRLGRRAWRSRPLGAGGHAVASVRAPPASTLAPHGRGSRVRRGRRPGSRGLGHAGSRDRRTSAMGTSRRRAVDRVDRCEVEELVDGGRSRERRARQAAPSAAFQQLRTCTGGRSCRS